MDSKKPANACHQCGATSYRPVVSRAPDGAMRPNCQYMCVRCKILFTTVDEWRLGEVTSKRLDLNVSREALCR